MDQLCTGQSDWRQRSKSSIFRLFQPFPHLDTKPSDSINGTYAIIFSSRLPLDQYLFGNIIQRMLNYINGSINSSPESMKLLASRLKVLAEPKRLLILEMIIQGLQCNCELGDALQMAPNLISHHLGKLREAGLVNAERDPLDSRWVYYSINRIAWDELNANFGAFFDPHRIQPRHLTCGPSANRCESDNQSTCSPEKPNHE